MTAQLSSGARVDGLFRELLDENRAGNGLSLTPKGRRINEARVAVAELVAAATKLVNRPGIAMQCGDDEARLRAALAPFSEAQS